MTKGYERADANTIVVGTDGSSGSDAALEWAVEEAFGSRRRVLVVHAFPLAETVVLAPLTLGAETRAASIVFPSTEHDFYVASLLSRGITCTARNLAIHNEGWLSPQSAALKEGFVKTSILIGTAGDDPPHRLPLPGPDELRCYAIRRRSQPARPVPTFTAP